jgi:peptide/nickel transport system permease protein
MAGGIVTIGAATGALAATALIGTVLGLFAAWRGGATGSTLLIATDSLVAVPEVIVALIAVSILGTNLTALMVAVIAAGWLPFARLSFELASRVLGSDYAIAAKMSGAATWRILVFTLLPNVSRPLIAHAFLRFPGKLLLLSGLSFLGLGPQPPTPEWGAMLAAGVAELERHPFVPLVPGLAIVTAGFAAAHVGRRLEASAAEPSNAIS